MIDYQQDGIDHINIFSRGKTSLGRFLSNFAYADIETEDGDFNSIEGYWYWLLHDSSNIEAVKDIESMRVLFGFDAKNLGKKLLERYGSRFSEEKQVDNDTDFQRKIKGAIKFKIDNNVKYKEELTTCTLPFEHYYVFYGKIKEPTSHRWVIDYFDELRKEYKNAFLL